MEFIYNNTYVIIATILGLGGIIIWGIRCKEINKDRK